MKIKIDKLDKLVSEYVRKRSKGYCERCGKHYGWKGLQASHFHPRRKRSVRYDADNMVALDFGCHQYFHENHNEFEEWFINYIGQKDFEMLEGRMRDMTKPDIELLTIYYQNAIKLSNKE